MKNDLPEIAALEALLREQRLSYLRSPYPSWETRAAHLKALRAIVARQPRRARRGHERRLRQPREKRRSCSRNSCW